MKSTPKTTLGEPMMITSSDLPLSCPRPKDEVWNKHPRVYLQLDQSNEAHCPYCGARYRLDTGEGN